MHIQSIGEKIIIIPTKPPTPDHIGDVVKSPLILEWYESIFKQWEDSNIHNIQCTIFTFVITTKHKDTQTQNIF